MEHVHQGLADNGVQGDQDQHGYKAPQAAAAHGNAFLLVQLLHGLALPCLVVRVLALDLLHLGGEPGHLHHALLGLGGDGQEHELHQHGKQDQGHAVAVCQLVQQLHQVTERHLDNVGKTKSENHGLSSLFLEVTERGHRCPRGRTGGIC